MSNEPLHNHNPARCALCAYMLIFGKSFLKKGDIMGIPLLIRVMGVILTPFICFHLGQTMPWVLIETVTVACLFLP